MALATKYNMFLENLLDIQLNWAPRLLQPSVKPPPLVLSRSFKAEILSQTVQEGHIQSRSVGQAGGQALC